MYVKTWLPSNSHQQLIYQLALFETKMPHFQDAFWKRSHQSSLSVPLAATHH